MTDTANLEDGFYWVREFSQSEWSVAKRSEGEWFLHDYEGALGHWHFHEIDPRPIKREP